MADESSGPVGPVGPVGLVGLVVAGAGARGAYESGALSVLVPRMAEDGSPPRILVGTSAGALNVVGLAGFSEHGWTTATSMLVQMWSSISMGQIMSLPSSLLADTTRYTAQLLGLPSSLPSLLDTRPLRATLERLLPLDGMHEAIRSGRIDAVAVATTSTGSKGTVVFVEKSPAVPLPAFDPSRNITYVETTLSVDHVMASAAVPVAFRPVAITEPAPVAGWYVDGGVRLNAPLKPALALGCSQLGVVATHPQSWPATPWSRSSEEPAPAAPDVFSAAALGLQALLADRMVEDLRTLSKVNRLVAAQGEREGYREVRFLFAGPPPAEANAIAELADDVYASTYSGLRGLRHPTVWMFDRLVGGTEGSHGELLSFFLFEPPFTGPAASLGARHAAAALSAERRHSSQTWQTVT